MNKNLILLVQNGYYAMTAANPIVAKIKKSLFMVFLATPLFAEAVSICGMTETTLPM
jgi:hypothetical protein